MKTEDVFVQLKTGELVLTYKGILKVMIHSGKFEEHFCTEVYEEEKLIGFLSYYRLVDGKKRYLFMTVSEVKKYAESHNVAFKYKRSGFWITNFSQMAKISVHKLNIMNPKETAYKIITEFLNKIKEDEQDSNFKKLHEQR